MEPLGIRFRRRGSVYPKPHSGGGYHAHVMDGFFEDSDDEMPPGASASTASYKLRL